jgi:hypothetical protein
MLLLKISGAHRQPVALIHRLVKLPVRALNFSAGLLKVPARLPELPPKRTKLKSEAIRFGARLLQVVRDMRIEREEKVCLSQGSRRFVLRSRPVRRFRHESSLPRGNPLASQL